MPRVAGANSCQTCRRRKLKCDEALPICKRCQRRSLYCDRAKTVVIHVWTPDSDARQQSQRSPRDELQDPSISMLFHVYIKQLAPWYDLNDHGRAFATDGPEKALQSPLLFAAVIAFAAIYMHRKSHFPANVAETYHSRCLQLLIALSEDDPAITDGTALASTCLLRSYEILAEENDPNRHLFGASTLVPSMTALSSNILLASGFWNYLREDITYSLMHECPLKLRLEPHTFECRTDDDCANYITLLLARTINSYFGASQDDLKYEIATWRNAYKPSHFALIEDSAFPTVKYVKDCQVAAMQYWYVAKCMLCDPQDMRREEYAGLITALAMSADSDPVVVNSYGPITFTAKWITDLERRNKLITFLESTQTRTGWSVKFIISKLKQQWE